MGNLFMEAKNEMAVLKIFYDESPSNPRDDDNLGEIVCWHRRYTIGDKHKYSDSRELFADLVRNTISANQVINYVKQGNAKNLIMEYSKSTREWEIKTYSESMDKWYYTKGSFSKNERDILFDSLIEKMCLEDLLYFARKNHLVLPVYMYDHSAVALNTTEFSCPWDSGQIGWTYVSHKDIRKEYGKLTKDTTDKASALLNSEVDIYSKYVNGEVYGFKIETTEGEEIDSCWGFFGDSFKTNGMDSYIPEEYLDLLDNLKYS